MFLTKCYVYRSFSLEDAAKQLQAATTPTHPLEWVEAKGRSDSLARLARDERHLRSKNRRSDLQFTLRLSQLAAFFIDARAERFTVQSLSLFSIVSYNVVQSECTTIHTSDR